MQKIHETHWTRQKIDIRLKISKQFKYANRFINDLQVKRVAAPEASTPQLLLSRA